MVDRNRVLYRDYILGSTRALRRYLCTLGLPEMLTAAHMSCHHRKDGSAIFKMDDGVCKVYRVFLCFSECKYVFLGNDMIVHVQLANSFTTWLIYNGTIFWHNLACLLRIHVDRCVWVFQTY